jgi:hypothetical protein
MILFMREMSKMATSLESLVNLANFVNNNSSPKKEANGKVATKSKNIYPLLAYLAMIFLWSLMI